MPSWMVWEASWQKIESNISKKPQTTQTWRYVNHYFFLWERGIWECLTLLPICMYNIVCYRLTVCIFNDISSGNLSYQIGEHLHCAASDQINQLNLINYLQVIQRNPLQDWAEITEPIEIIERAETSEPPSLSVEETETAKWKETSCHQWPDPFYYSLTLQSIPYMHEHLLTLCNL